MFRRVIFMFCVFFLHSCNSPSATSNQQTLKTNTDLSLFQDTSLTLLSENSETAAILEQWPAVKNIVSNVKMLLQANQNDIMFQLKTLSEEIIKVKTNEFPEPFKQPSVIGRFRVLKTFVLKAHLTDASLITTPEYKETLVQIIHAHNAFMNQLNVVAKENLNEDTIINF